MRHPDSFQKLVQAAFLATSVLLILTAAVWGARLLITHRAQSGIPLATNTNVISGFPTGGHPAPDFTLVNQFSQTVTLSSLRGHEVVLAFIDSRCTSLCPLTAKIMYDAKARLKSSASQVELVAVNANPAATSIPQVQDWSIKHGMLHQWLFLTGTAQQLQAIYRAYSVYDQVNSDGQAVHDPLLYIIDAKGHEQLYFETLSSNNTSDISSEETGLEIGMRQWLPQPAMKQATHAA
ncbi:MAG: SCO family protein [Chloroflexota bacterium]|nr:SCO family protein [Chloroflexota bacterium]